MEKTDILAVVANEPEAEVTNILTNSNNAYLELSSIPLKIAEAIQKEGIEDINFDQGKLVIEGINKELIELTDAETNAIHNWLTKDLGRVADFNLTNMNQTTKDDFFIHNFDKKLRITTVHYSMNGNNSTCSSSIRISPIARLLDENEIKKLIFGFDIKERGIVKNNIEQVKYTHLKFDDNSVLYYAQEIYDILKNIINFNDTPNIIISGETGSGKTELSKTFINQIPFAHKVVIVQDSNDMAAKKLFPDKDINEFFTKGNNKEEKLESFNLSVDTALTFNPRWLIISEVRSLEVESFIKALLTGHSGITTLHAANGEDTLRRISEEYGKNIDAFARLINYVIHMKVIYNKDGSKVRKINQIMEYDPTIKKHRCIYDYEMFVTTGCPYDDEGRAAERLKDKYGTR